MMLVMIMMLMIMMMTTTIMIICGVDEDKCDDVDSHRYDVIVPAIKIINMVVAFGCDRQ